MSRSEAQKQADKKYKEKVETVRFELYPSDVDIKERLAREAKENGGQGKASYIKRLIREDIKKDGE